MTVIRKIDEAEAFLQERLSTGPCLSSVLKIEAQKLGISTTVLRRAAVKLELSCTPDKIYPRKTVWALK